jgi:hypothetical protein
MDWNMLFEFLGVRKVSAREIRAEAFFLGNRHHGRVVEGARLELKTPDLPARRAVLLRAVIRATPAPHTNESDQ